MVTVLDSFEDGDLSEYSGDTGGSSVGTPAFDGSNALQFGDSGGAITRVDQTIAPEETPFGAYLLSSGTNPFGLEAAPEFFFGVQSAVGKPSLDAYALTIETDDSNLILKRYDVGTSTELASTSTNQSLSQNTFYETRVTEWTQGGSITAELRTAGGSVLATLSTTDDTYGSGGYGWGEGIGLKASFDYAFKPFSLPPPSNVAIIDSQTEDELTLDWDPVSNASGYYVYHAEQPFSDPSAATQVADVTTPPYTDTNLEDGEQYYIRLTAYDGDTESDLSAEVNARTALPAPTIQYDGSLESLYRFDGDVTDSSPNGRDGTVTTGSITYESSAYGQKAVFDGGAVVTVPNAPWNRLQSATTIIVRLQTTQGGGYHGIVGHHAPSNGYTGWAIALNSGQLSIWTDTDSWTDTSLTINDGVMRTLIISMDDNGVFEVYSDVEGDASTPVVTANKSLPSANTGQPLYIGDRQNTDGDFNGKIDVVRFHDGEL